MARPLILHGENQSASRGKLISTIEGFKQKGWEVIHLDSPTTTELLNSAASESLFSSNQLIAVENFITSQKESVDTLLKLPQDSCFIFWEKKQLAPSVVKKLSDRFTFQEFKIPVVLFKLLDALGPGNTKQVLELFEKGKETTQDELVFAMLARQVRLLLWAKLDPGSLKTAPWQKSKLLAQASRFSRKQLQSLHTKLLEIDRSYKNSQLPENLAASLELLFTSV